MEVKVRPNVYANRSISSVKIDARVIAGPLCGAIWEQRQCGKTAPIFGRFHAVLALLGYAAAGRELAATRDLWRPATPCPTRFTHLGAFR
jgi:hypothetical protein